MRLFFVKFHLQTKFNSNYFTLTYLNYLIINLWKNAKKG